MELVMHTIYTAMTSYIWVFFRITAALMAMPLLESKLS